MLATKIIAAVVFALVMWGVSTGARGLVNGYGWQAGIVAGLAIIAVGFTADWLGRRQHQPE